MITVIQSKSKFYLLCVVFHALLLLLFHVWATLMAWDPTRTPEEFGRGICVLVAIFILGEFGRRFDFLFFSYEAHLWLWSAQLFPPLTKAVYWAVKAVQMLLIVMLSMFLVVYWDSLPTAIQGYGLFAVGLLFFAGFDFLVNGHRKFNLLRIENCWMNNVRFTNREEQKLPDTN